MKYITFSLALIVALAITHAFATHPVAATAHHAAPVTEVVSHITTPAVARTMTVQAASQASCSYTVQPGDTLSIIAARFNLTWPTLFQLNRTVVGADPDMLVPGEQLTTCGAATSAPVAPKPPAPPVNNSPVNSVPTGTGSVQQMISQTFGGYAGGAMTIARCESGFDANARNTIAVYYNGHYLGHAMGVFQIVDATWASTSYAKYSPYNAWANIQAAHEIFVRDGYSWREWQCKA
jgi:hypothetical protein